MIQKISYINEVQKLRKAYYYEESECKRLRKQANIHAANKREIFEIIMKKIEQSEK